MFILFGRSPFVNKIKPYIPELQKKYITGSVNTIIPGSEFCFLADAKTIRGIKEDYSGQTIITEINYKRFLDYANITNYELYTFTGGSEPTLKENYLSFYGLSHSIALNWAYKKGLKIILAGIDLDGSMEHFDSEQIFNPVQGVIDDCIKQIENYPGEILQLNPDSKMRVPKTTIERLLWQM